MQRINLHQSFIFSLIIGSAALAFGCERGSSGPECSSPDDCEDGEFCSSDDVCIPEGSCSTSADCELDEFCNAMDECVERPECSEINPCTGANEICSDAGYCIPNDECRTDDDCDEGKSCFGDQCITDSTSCETDQQCLEANEDFPICSESGTCTIDPECGFSEILAGGLGSKLVIAIDRSGSMKQAQEAGSSLNKWESAASAMAQFTALFDDDLGMGFIPFPDPKIYQRPDNKVANCEQQTYEIGDDQLPFATEDDPPLEGGTAKQIRDLMSASANNKMHRLNPENGPDGTNIFHTISYLMANEPSFQPDSGGGNLLLITDGKETCEKKDPKPKINELIRQLKQDRDVTTFVMGFGNFNGINVPALNLWAETGGKACPDSVENPDVNCPDDTKFYFARNGAEFLKQLLTIGSLLRGCEYTFEDDDNHSADPETGSDVRVYVNGALQPVSNGSSSGWTLDWTPGNPGKGVVTFHGTICNQIKSNPSIKSVSIVLGCQTSPG